MGQNIVAKVVSAIAYYVTDILFREIVIINDSAIPRRGPLIMYGNHNNQFIDGMLMKRACPRSISFVAAASSLRKPVIGPFLSAAGVIPLQRAQDLARLGPGTIIRVEGNHVFGSQTAFSQLESEMVLDLGQAGQMRIKQVVSDTQVVVNRIPVQEINFPAKYKVIPKMDYHQLYSDVWGQLGQGGCVGIFPEGGSHDRTEMIPLKAGICIFALGAMEKHGTPVTLVSCGFNYFNPQKYRSKVIIQFGVPYTIPMQLVQLYKLNRKEAIGTLLKEIENRLLLVTTHSHNFNNLSAVFTIRELYMLGAKQKYTEKEKIEINRRFLKGCEEMLAIKSPEVAKLIDDISKFDAFVRNNGLRVSSSLREHSIFYDLIVLVFYLIKTINRLLITLPGLILLYPSIQFIARKAELDRIKCLKGSKVKIVGNDVVGSSKLRLSIIVLPVTFLFISAIFFVLSTYFTKWKLLTRVVLSVLIFILFPFYLKEMMPSLDTLGHTWKKLKYLFLRLFKRNSCKTFNRLRLTLSQRVIEAVRLYAPQVFPDFEQIRIISEKELHQNQRVLHDHLQQINTSQTEIESGKVI